MNLYVWYDVSTDVADALARDVRAMQAALRARRGVVGRVMKRSDAKDGRETWMEVYEGVDDAFEAELAHAASSLDGHGASRHVERFVEL